MKVVGLTGGVACGKSTVARRMEEAGIPIIDTDELAHLLFSKSEILFKIETELGTSDRQELREMVFASAEARKKLESILHPAIELALHQELHLLRNTPPVPMVAVVVVPLLFEAGWERHMDETVAVVCDEKLARERLIARDKISEELAQRMIESQFSAAEKAKRANHVIWNNGSKEDLDVRVDEVILSICSPQAKL